MPGTAAMDPRDAAFSSGDDDGIVITLIDSRHFPILAEVASRNIVMVKDLSVASGLLILPPVQDTLDAFPHATLVDLCYEVCLPAPDVLFFLYIFVSFTED